jgi:toxin ParE1/3/4
MKRFSLSRRAEGSLDSIGAFSRETFGKTRGDVYVATLLDRCRKIAAGQMPNQSCHSQFGEDLRANLRFARSGRHFIIFIETATEFVIVDFIHQSADIGGRLGGPDE